MTGRRKRERERRWFSLAEAAAVVDEPDLADLFRSFGASEFNKAAKRTGMLSVVAQKSKVGPMFAWFQRLLPRTGGFFELFEAHAVAVLAAADATGRLFQGGPKCHEHIREIREREHDADEIVREMLKTIRHTFLTPFDRGAITALIGSMDDAIDEMQSAASAVDVYEMTEFDAPMRDMVAIAVDAARLVAEAMPLMRDVAANGPRLHELTERLGPHGKPWGRNPHRGPESGIPALSRHQSDQLCRAPRNLQASRAHHRRVRRRRQPDRQHRD